MIAESTQTSSWARGHKAIVTGATRGIGAAVAQQLGESGASVVVVARNARRVEESVARLSIRGVDAWGIVCDVANHEALVSAVRDLPAAFCPLDIVVNNAAAVEPLGRFADITADAWAASMRTNATAAFALLRETVPGMLAAGWGRIVSVSTTSVVRFGFMRANAYMASKAALEALTLGLAHEMEMENGPVRANVVRPGPTDTGMQAFLRLRHRDQVGEAFVRKFHEFQAEGRLGNRTEVARLIVAVLASGQNRKVFSPYDAGIADFMARWAPSA